MTSNLKSAALAAILTSALFLIFIQSPATTQTPQTTYDRVLKTKTLRCGYMVIPPMIEKDSSTGKLSGMMVDIMEGVGKRLDVKIDWAEEVTFESAVTSLQTHRLDAICFNYWRNPNEGKYVGFSTPIFFNQSGIYARANDHRFDRNLNAINDPSISISIVDGELENLIAAEDFPQAKIKNLPGMTDLAQTFEEVATGKADIAIRDTYMGSQYIANNKGKLKWLNPNKPLRIFVNTIAVPIEDVPFKSMVDTALQDMIEQGVIDKLITKYQGTPGTFLPVAKQYEK